MPTSASVDGLLVTDSRLDANAVIGLSMYGPVNNLLVSNSTFTGNGLVGIYGGKLHQGFAGSRITVIDGVTANGNGRGLALRIYGGSLTITSSTASGNNSDVDPGNIGQGLDLSVREAETDILLSGVTAEDNEDVNIFLETKSGGSIGNAAFHRVKVTGSNDEPTKEFCDGCGIWLHTLGTAELSNVSITSSTVTGNNRGIVLEAETMPITSVTIAENDIQPDVSTIGLAVSDGAAVGNQAFCNNIIGSGVGVDNQDVNDFNARDNYWGDASGPHHARTNPSGLGTEVGDNVAYDSWLIIRCGIFFDGFESGNTLRWSSPPP